MPPNDSAAQPSAGTAPGDPSAPPGAASASGAQNGIQLPAVVVEQKAAPKSNPKPRKSAAKSNGGPAQAPDATMSVPPPVSTPPSTEGPVAASAASGSETSQAQSKPGLSSLTSTTLDASEIQSEQAGTSDTASLLENVPGVSLYQGGGVSSLPAIDGLSDDRIRILVNDMAVTSACANHMNPPLSYADPAQVKRIDVVSGLAPVSIGGDSIGGTISVETLPPEFALPGEGLVKSGRVSGSWRSNGNARSMGAGATAGTQNVAIAYSGAWTRAESYEDGAGVIVGSTNYEATNHTLSLAARDGGALYVLEGGYQNIPYQGFVNQPMDMELNNAWHVSGRYENSLDWGKLAIKGYHHRTRHKMNFLDEKQASFEKAGWGSDWVMPMNTLGTDSGTSVRADIAASDRDIVRMGSELHHQTLEDWWPPVCSTPYCGMGPSNFLNINDGERTRIGTFLEWERKWDRDWSTIVGARSDVVHMDTGDVSPYERIEGDVDTAAAEAFNAKDHERTDVNVDLTALARFEPKSFLSAEGGYARKTRSPNLYERYAWGESTMTSQMTTWFGDANGYIGNLDLEPEIAHRISLTLGLHDTERRVFDVRITPYLTYVEDFINAEMVAPEGWVNGFNQLRFVNHDARLYGIDLSGRALLAESEELGRVSLSGVIGYVNGEDQVTGNPLYHMMPWNARLSLEHRLGGWTSIAEVHLVDDKLRVDEARLEPVTSGYALFNLRTSYEWDNVRLDLGVDNVLDRLYFAPLAGTNYTDYLLPGHAVAGMGRSFYTGLTVKF